MSNTGLVGRKNVVSFTERSWNTIRKWIKEDGFPAAKVDGVWESDTELIRRWRQRRIQQSNGSREETK